jgi:superoxide dismutase, Fe-Mn family
MTGSKEQQLMPKELAQEIEMHFKSINDFKAQFEAQARSLFGSGWVWLIRDSNGVLKITTTVNQDNPLMDVVKQRGQPILALDVWEHAYYLNYQNKRADYIKNFWKIVNWQQVESYRLETMKMKKN